MIYKETLLKIVDNSGVVWAKCIKVEGNCNKKIARLGDRVYCSVYKVVSKEKIKKKKYVALIVSVKNFTKRLDGS